MRRRLWAAAVLIACGVGALTTGCAGSSPEPRETPEQFLERESLPSCGELTLAQGDEIPDENMACLLDAGEAGAELAVTRPTTEGDPVTEYYRVLPGGGWQAYIDGTEDRHGGDWWFTDCPDAETIEDLATCRGVVL
ncbi:MAG: hypothetical protein ABWY26_07940 [Microbacterium sp.]